MKPQLLALRERIAAAGLDALADAIMAQARPAVDLILDGASSGEIGECRFGGAPDLPPAMAWPRDENGKAFVFLLQLNLAQVPAFDENPLPPHGMLWLFLGSDEGAANVAHRIVLWQGAEELQPTLSPPLEELIEEDFADIPPMRVRPELRADVPPWCSDEYYALTEQMSGEEQKAYRQVTQIDERCIGLLFGYVTGIGHDPRKMAIEARETEENKYRSDNRAVLGTSHLHQWRSLLCLLSVFDGDWVFCIWDAGYLNFLIHQDDLQKLDFSRVYAAVESS